MATSTGPVCYGPNLRAVAVYLVVFQHVPVERAALLIADLTGAEVSTGWVCAQIARAADALVDVEALIKTLLTLAAVIGVDETSLNVAGNKQWLHVARTEWLTAYHLHESRGRVAVNEFGVLPGYCGTVVRDTLAVYDAYPATCALCGAHLIRELTAVAEQHPPPNGRSRRAAHWPISPRSPRRPTSKGFPRSHPTRPPNRCSCCGTRCSSDCPSTPEQRARKQSKARNLLERLRNRQADILRFTTDSDVPFTNNGSERDLRPVKTQLKISGCHRAATGARAWLRVRGYTDGGNVNTARTSSPHSTMPSPGIPGAQHNPYRPEWSRSRRR